MVEVNSKQSGGIHDQIKHFMCHKNRKNKYYEYADT